MMCQWEQALSVLPLWLRPEVNTLGKEQLQELRLRINAPPELKLGSKRILLDRCISREDLLFVVNTASRYSPWASETVSQGYLTVSGGHRLGLCGEAVMRNGAVTGIREVRSVNLRIARDFPGIADGIRLKGSVLILGAPGWGKTTLLRDLCRKIAQSETVCVVDERGELFPEGTQPGVHMDVLTGCGKTQGISIVLRTMGPAWIAVDEITSPEDTAALLQTMGCGVNLVATAHGNRMEDLHQRSVYKPLLEQNVFQTVLLLGPDKSFRTERIPS